MDTYPLSCELMLTSRLMYILTPSGSPGGANGKMGVGKWPSLIFLAGALLSAAAHRGAVKGVLCSIVIRLICLSSFSIRFKPI